MRILGIAGSLRRASYNRGRIAAAVELAPLAGLPGKRAYDIFLDCFHKGALLRPAGDVLVLAPPYIASAQEIDMIVDRLGAAVDAVIGEIAH